MEQTDEKNKALPVPIARHYHQLFIYIPNYIAWQWSSLILSRISHPLHRLMVNEMANFLPCVQTWCENKQQGSTSHRVNPFAVTAVASFACRDTSLPFSHTFHPLLKLF